MTGEPIEIELKLEFQPDAGGVLRAAPELGDAGDGADRHLVATYFETPDGDLEKAGFSLRIRRDGRQHVQTLKAGGKAAGLFVRPEWDRPVRGWTPVLDDPDSPFVTALDPAWRERISAAFTTDVRRNRRCIAFGDARVECAIDIGTVDTGVHQDALAEVELELLEGRPASLFDLARGVRCSGRTPAMIVPVRARRASATAPDGTSVTPGPANTPLSLTALMKFIGGLPMNPATNLFTGVS